MVVTVAHGDKEDLCLASYISCLKVQQDAEETRRESTYSVSQQGEAAAKDVRHPSDVRFVPDGCSYGYGAKHTSQPEQSVAEALYTYSLGCV